jgi:hypothetical protein
VRLASLPLAKLFPSSSPSHSCLSFAENTSMQVFCDYEMSKKRESCKERDIFFDWKHKIDQDKHFFRIMVGDFVKEW